MPCTHGMWPYYCVYTRPHPNQGESLLYLMDELKYAEDLNSWISNLLDPSDEERTTASESSQRECFSWSFTMLPKNLKQVCTLVLHQLHVHLNTVLKQSRVWPSRIYCTTFMKKKFLFVGKGAVGTKCDGVFFVKAQKTKHLIPISWTDYLRKSTPADDIDKKNLFSKILKRSFSIFCLQKYPVLLQLLRQLQLQFQFQLQLQLQLLLLFQLQLQLLFLLSLQLPLQLQLRLQYQSPPLRLWLSRRQFSSSSPPPRMLPLLCPLPSPLRIPRAPCC